MYVSQSGDLVEKNSTYGRRTALMYASPPTRATFIGSHDDVFLLQLKPTASHTALNLRSGRSTAVVEIAASVIVVVVVVAAAK